MFDPQTEVATVETRLKAVGRNVPEFIREAGVHPATWRRWRNGETSPNFSSWKKVARALERLEAQ